MSGFDFSMMFSRLLGSTPSLLVIVGGIALCLTRESRPLRVRVLVGTALAIQLFNFFAVPLVMTAIARQMQPTPVGANPSLQFLLMNLFASSASAVALALLLWAAFTRDEQPPA